MGAIEDLVRWADHPADFVREVFETEPDAWQIDALEAFPRSPRLALKAPLSLDATVETPGGSKAWGEIKPGDELFADDGTITRVLRRFDRAPEQLYRISFRDGTSVEATGDHEWLVQTSYDRKRERYRTVSTEQLRAMQLKNSFGQRLVSVPLQGAARFPEAPLPADPYVFGLWLGDGIANEPQLICPD